MAKYRVSGTQPVMRHLPGAVFEADLDEKDEERLIRIGAIEKARADAKVKEGEEDG